MIEEVIEKQAKKHEADIQRKNKELCRLKKKVKIQKSKFFFSLSKI